MSHTVLFGLRSVVEKAAYFVLFTMAVKAAASL
jgi:hypothetical protein